MEGAPKALWNWYGNVIENDKDLAVAKKQERRLEAAISAIRREHRDDRGYADELVAPYGALLSSVRADIDRYLGVGPLAGADLEIRVESPEIGREGAPSSILTETLDRLRKSLAGSYAVVGKFKWSGRGRHTEEIRKATDVRVLALAPGSLRLGIDLPEAFHRRTLDNYGPTATPEVGPARRALATMLSAAEWAASDAPTSDLESRIPDPAVRRSILEQVRRLSPTPKGKISSIELSGVSMQTGQIARLTPLARARARQAAYPSVETEEFSDTGILRAIAIDLDRGYRVFELRNRPSGRANVRGDFPLDLANEVIDATKLGYRVKLAGILESGKKGKTASVLHLDEIERVEAPQ